MPERFALSFAGDPVQLVNRAKQIAAQNHVRFDGDEHSGNFSGDGVAGTYKVENHTVTITINRKPFFVAMDVIREHLQQFFAA